MPILGIIDSSKSKYSLVGSYYSLGSISLTASTSAVTFVGIPQDYTHLEIRGLAKTARATTDDGLYIRFNGDNTGSYVAHTLWANSSTVSSFLATTTTDTEIETYFAPGSSGTSNCFGANIINILDYANTKKNSTVRVLGGYDFNGGGTTAKIGMASGLWNNTAAITSITLFGGNADLVANSTFALYGVK